jgi:hypothetical protein
MGSKDRDDKFASYLTTIKANRTGVNAADTLPDDREDIPVINLTTSQSAHSNTIVVIPEKTGGAGTITLQLWRLASGYPDWTLVSTTAATAAGVEVRFSNLLAAQYQLVCSTLSGGSTWSLYEAHTEK